MFDFAWSELMVIGAVALVVIGPKDLPRALKTAGMLVRRARGMAREFQNSIDDLIRESEIDEMRKSVNKATQFDLNQSFTDTIDPKGELMKPLIPEDRKPHPADLPSEPLPVAAPDPMPPKIETREPATADSAPGPQPPPAP